MSSLLSCGQKASSDNVRNSKSSEKDSLHSPTSDTLNRDRWHFKEYLNDPKTPQLAKNIFTNNWILKDDEPLAFLEKLHGQDKDARPFYFRVVTNSYKQADGAYSEGLGHAGYEYVRNYPGEFSSYFVGQDAFTDNDLQTWADIVMLEFQIISENEYDKPLLAKYLDTVTRNCRDCSGQQKKILEKFGSYLNQRWTAYLKHIDK